MAKPPKSPTNTNLAPFRAAEPAVVQDAGYAPDATITVAVAPIERPITYCRTCFFGRTRIDGHRVCRARRPDSKSMGSQVVFGRGTRTLAEALFPQVADEEWCGDGTPDGWPVVRPAA